MKLLLLLFFLVNCLFAQSFRYGIYGGFNFSEAERYMDTETETHIAHYGAERSIQIGYGLGLIADFPLLDNISFSPRFGYAMRKSSSKLSDWPKYYFAHFIELDLTLKLKFNRYFFCRIGTKVDYLLVLTSERRNIALRYVRNRIEGGFLAGVGFMFDPKIFFTISWYRQLYKDFDGIKARPFLTDYSIMAEVGYYLN